MALVTTATLKTARFQSTVATGTSPLVVASTTLVTNLNADLIDGFEAAALAKLAGAAFTGAVSMAETLTVVGALTTTGIHNIDGADNYRFGGVSQNLIGLVRNIVGAGSDNSQGYYAGSGNGHKFFANGSTDPALTITETDNVVVKEASWYQQYDAIAIARNLIRYDSTANKLQLRESRQASSDFVADGYIAIVDGAGNVVYLPCSTTTPS